MRKALNAALLQKAAQKDDRSWFLTGDLGFMAFEELEKALGKRFTNCGIAEQNMISLGAGLAHEGFQVYAYSIAPFIYARAFEQIRNDVAAHGLNVCLIGNGAGYGYGVQGPTHHSLEDCALMRSAGDRMRICAPAFAQDVQEIINDWQGPTWLRLGLDSAPKNFARPSYRPWRKLLAGEKGVWAVFGNLAGEALQALSNLPEGERPELWAVCEFSEPPGDFLEAAKANALTIFEEHVAPGGFGEYLSLALLHINLHPKLFKHFHALGYPGSKFGSQNYHRSQCGLTHAAMRRLLEKA